MNQRDNDLRVRPGRIRDSGRGPSRPKSFVGQVMRAAKKAGHVGQSFGRGKGGASRSRFGRGRRAALSLSLRSTSRRVVMKARVVSHHGASLPLGAAVQAHHLFEARGRDAGRRGSPDVRRDVGCGGRTRFRRALQG